MGLESVEVVGVDIGRNKLKGRRIAAKVADLLPLLARANKTIKANPSH